MAAALLAASVAAPGPAQVRQNLFCAASTSDSCAFGDVPVGDFRGWHVQGRRSNPEPSVQLVNCNNVQP